MEVVAGMAGEDDEGTSRAIVRVSLEKPMEQLGRGCVSLPEGRRNRVSKGRVTGPTTSSAEVSELGGGVVGEFGEVGFSVWAESVFVLAKRT